MWFSVSQSGLLICLIRGQHYPLNVGYYLGHTGLINSPKTFEKKTQNGVAPTGYQTASMLVHQTQWSLFRVKQNNSLNEESKMLHWFRTELRPPIKYFTSLQK